MDSSPMNWTIDTVAIIHENPRSCIMIARTVTAYSRYLPNFRAVKRKLTAVSSLGPTIVQLDDAVLAYSDDDKRRLGPLQLSVQHPSTGGHVLLGKNASGKSLIAYSLASLGNDEEASDYLRAGSYSTEDGWHKRAVAKVSFQSHEQLLTKGGTVSKTISDGGYLSKAAKFLVVRFGLYHHLHRQVNTLSTGEIRKVLLIKALATRPRLLILDNAFDGLDVETRETLKDLVSRTIQGFRPDILVQSVSAKATAHTQVLLLTNRAEEIVDDIKHVTILQNDSLVTFARNGESGATLLNKAFGQRMSFAPEEPWQQLALPSALEIHSYWGDRASFNEEATELIRTNRLHFARGEAVLLQNLTWSVNRGERWLIAGRNGAGKSTLGRLLARFEMDIPSDQFSVLENDARPDGRRRNVGWCSTELHLKLSLEKSGQTVQDIFESEGATPDMMNKILAWLNLEEASFPSHRFTDLSQGQQKLILIGATIASRPNILVLDEITQGLDLVNRNRILGLLERICQATDVTLVYITHHLEEILPSITHILHLVQGEAVYCGTVQGYDALATKTLKQASVFGA